MAWLPVGFPSVGNHRNHTNVRENGTGCAKHLDTPRRSRGWHFFSGLIFIFRNLFSTPSEVKVVCTILNSGEGFSGEFHFGIQSKWHKKPTCLVGSIASLSLACHRTAPAPGRILGEVSRQRRKEGGRANKNDRVWRGPRERRASEGGPAKGIDSREKCGSGSYCWHRECYFHAADVFEAVVGAHRNRVFAFGQGRSVP